jgi:HEAT repeat protein
MLSREQAEKRLQAFRVANWLERRLADLAELSPDLREIGLAFLGCDAQGRWIEDWAKRMEVERQAAEALEGRSAGDRLRLFNALFPQIGPHVAYAWEMAKRFPYQTGPSRRPFRAPRTSITTLGARLSWLISLRGVVEGYEQDICWFAAWAPYLGWDAPHTLGLLFAAAVEAGGPEGEETFRILQASALGEHEIGGMGRHVIRAFLSASRPEGWDLIERLLLTAQREEGLRQAILESVDEAHPEAFRRMLRLILEHDLTRFSATIRAVDVWFGFDWRAEDASEVKRDLGQVLRFLDDPSAREEVLRKGDGRSVYLALWTIAFEDAIRVLEPAEKLLTDADVERRFATVYLLRQVRLVGSNQLLSRALEDPDLRVAACALEGLVLEEDGEDYERLERLLSRFPARARWEPILWPWMRIRVTRSDIADSLARCLGARPFTVLLPYLPHMSPRGRARAVRKIAEDPDWLSHPEGRQTLLKMLGDPSPEVRGGALQALRSCTLRSDEMPFLESLLIRKAADLRRGVLELLLKQEDAKVLESARRLLTADHPLQRLAGLELLRQMVESGRSVPRCQALVAQCLPQDLELSSEESALLAAIRRAGPPPSLEDALGLMDPSQRTPPRPPRVPDRFRATQGSSLVTPATVALLKALDEWIHQHRDVPVLMRSPHGEEMKLLGNMSWDFPTPYPSLPLEEDLARLPLRDLWERWWNERPPALRDTDGLELLRALAVLRSWNSWLRPPPWVEKLRPLLFGTVDVKTVRYRRLVESVLEWMLRLSSPENAVDFLLDAVEFTLACIPAEAMIWREDVRYDWRDDHSLIAWLDLARLHRRFWPEMWKGEHHVRLWRLLRWMDEPVSNVQEGKHPFRLWRWIDKPAKKPPRHRPYLEEVLLAFEAGGATEADLLDYLLGPQNDFYTLGSLSGRKPSQQLQEHPVLQNLVQRCRERILEIELQRGDMPTAASRPALALRYTGGLDVLVRALQAMGRATFVHRRSVDQLSRPAVLSHIIRATFPSESDTPEAFAEQARAAKIPRRRLIELAVFAPQWARHVEHAVGWPGLEEAAWWIHAHTKDRRWDVPLEIREAWQAEIAERTPLSAEDLLDGAVDVMWFQKAYAALGPERWQEVQRAAKYASSGSGHRRAQLFADALRGHVKREDLIRRIREKRHQDSVRALGLLPLADGPSREQDLLERYRLLQEFSRSSRQFGALRRESEQRAVAIAMQNLARTAGYSDPIRLQWAMEALEVQDLIDGKISVTSGDTTITLAINDWGKATLSIQQEGRELRSIPARLRKDPQVAHLLLRKRELEQQASRIRTALEQAMCRGDRFTGAELRSMLRHPILAPMLRQLIFLIEGSDLPEDGPSHRMGYPVDDGKALQSHDGRRIPIAETDVLRIAHPYDLFISGEWSLWQRECFLTERIQPFKQVFRELYLLTPAEKAEGDRSYRYAGHQVQPRRAMALLAQRGWVYFPEEGARRAFHKEGLSAWVMFQWAPFTPAEVEGLTIETVGFTRRGDWKLLPLTEIPPRIFSEVMRDLDLVVSVAHAGGVDPEASASTIEMRAALIRETCALLRLDNVRLQGSHALIEGQLGSYSVHLGSGVVHRRPGGALCIIPVHSQHRGRLFLPFADDDPRTAEVLSKVILLARDSEIKDPTILQQILT